MTIATSEMTYLNKEIKETEIVIGADGSVASNDLFAVDLSLDGNVLTNW